MTNLHDLKMQVGDGKMRQTDVADTSAKNNIAKQKVFVTIQLKKGQPLPGLTFSIL
ncbi:MAG TPA: hypothetical protein VLY84_09240 [Dysgonamonadaceae bacterium]|nr:hypothetical protein [Dysgonamonadaceae bacterium]